MILAGLSACEIHVEEPPPPAPAARPAPDARTAPGEDAITVAEVSAVIPQPTAQPGFDAMTEPDSGPEVAVDTEPASSPDWIAQELTSGDEVAATRALAQLLADVDPTLVAELESLLSDAIATNGDSSGDTQ